MKLRGSGRSKLERRVEKDRELVDMDAVADNPNARTAIGLAISVVLVHARERRADVRSMIVQVWKIADEISANYPRRYFTTPRCVTFPLSPFHHFLRDFCGGR